MLLVLAEAKLGNADHLNCFFLRTTNLSYVNKFLKKNDDKLKKKDNMDLNGPFFKFNSLI